MEYESKSKECSVFMQTGELRNVEFENHFIFDNDLTRKDEDKNPVRV